MNETQNIVDQYIAGINIVTTDKKENDEEYDPPKISEDLLEKMESKPFSFLKNKTDLFAPLDQIDENSAEYQNSILSKMSKKSTLSKMSA